MMEVQQRVGLMPEPGQEGLESAQMQVIRDVLPEDFRRKILSNLSWIAPIPDEGVKFDIHVVSEIEEDWMLLHLDKLVILRSVYQENLNAHLPSDTFENLETIQRTGKPMSVKIHDSTSYEDEQLVQVDFTFIQNWFKNHEGREENKTMQIMVPATLGGFVNKPPRGTMNWLHDFTDYYFRPPLVFRRLNLAEKEHWENDFDNSEYLGAQIMVANSNHLSKWMISPCGAWTWLKVHEGSIVFFYLNETNHNDHQIFAEWSDDLFNLLELFSDESESEDERSHRATVSRPWFPEAWKKRVFVRVLEKGDSIFFPGANFHAFFYPQNTIAYFGYGLTTISAEDHFRTKSFNHDDVHTNVLGFTKMERIFLESFGKIKRDLMKFTYARAEANAKQERLTKTQATDTIVNGTMKFDKIKETLIKKLCIEWQPLAREIPRRRIRTFHTALLVLEAPLQKTLRGLIPHQGGFKYDPTSVPLNAIFAAVKASGFKTISENVCGGLDLKPYIKPTRENFDYTTNADADVSATVYPKLVAHFLDGKLQIRAAEKHKEKTVIGECNGEFVNLLASRTRYRSLVQPPALQEYYIRDKDKRAMAADDIYLDSTWKGGLEFWLGKSDDPNCKIVRAISQKRRFLEDGNHMIEEVIENEIFHIVTTKEISPDDELTLKKACHPLAEQSNALARKLKLPNLQEIVKKVVKGLEKSPEVIHVTPLWRRPQPTVAIDLSTAVRPTSSVKSLPNVPLVNTTPTNPQALPMGSRRLITVDNNGPEIDTPPQHGQSLHQKHVGVDNPNTIKPQDNQAAAISFSVPQAPPNFSKTLPPPQLQVENSAQPGPALGQSSLAPGSPPLVQGHEIQKTQPGQTLGQTAGQPSGSSPEAQTEGFNLGQQVHTQDRVEKEITSSHLTHPPTFSPVPTDGGQPGPSRQFPAPTKQGPISKLKGKVGRPRVDSDPTPSTSTSIKSSRSKRRLSDPNPPPPTSVEGALAQEAEDEDNEPGPSVVGEDNVDIDQLNNPTAHLERKQEYVQKIVARWIRRMERFVGPNQEEPGGGMFDLQNFDYASLLVGVEEEDLESVRTELRAKRSQRKEDYRVINIDRALLQKFKKTPDGCPQQFESWERCEVVSTAIILMVKAPTLCCGHCLVHKHAEFGNPKVYGTISSKNKHMREYHMVQKTFKCGVPNCRAAYNSSEELQRHVEAQMIQPNPQHVKESDRLRLQKARADAKAAKAAQQRGHQEEQVEGKDAEEERVTEMRSERQEGQGSSQESAQGSAQDGASQGSPQPPPPPRGRGRPAKRGRRTTK